MNHNKINHKDMSHKDHEAAMTDPQMATFMERDMRNRFLWSLFFTIPMLLYSPVAIDFFKIRLLTLIPPN